MNIPNESEGFGTTLVIGIGLIGSSFIQAIEQLPTRLTATVLASDHSPEVCCEARTIFRRAKVIHDLSTACAQADLVVLAVPVCAISSLCRTIAPHLKPGCIVTDTGSVKHAVSLKMSQSLPDHVTVIPGHPIAGTENSGPRAGHADLFRNRWCILTPSPETHAADVERLARLWRDLGMRVECMDAAKHDLIFAMASHLPHLIAYTLVGAAGDFENDEQTDVLKFSAGGFQDFTRIAASDPGMWRDVFLTNHSSVMTVLDRFLDNLAALRLAITQGDGDALFDAFDRVREIRKKMVDTVGESDRATKPDHLT